jgi:glycosyltransferase involved in cell wall biosynthesis
MPALKSILQAMLQAKHHLAQYLIRQYRSLQTGLLPSWSRRRGLYLLGVKGVKVVKNEGTLSFLRRVTDKVRRSLIWGEPLLIGIEAQAELNRQYVGWLDKNSFTQQDFAQMKSKVKQLAYKPLISIATPVFNVAEVWLRKTVESVLEQTYPYWELCLVDDGSTETHVSLVLKEYAAKDNRVKVVFLEENAGIAKATNKALEMATGEFVAFLDHDDELAPQALFKVVERLNETPDLDLIYSDEDKIETDGTHVDPFFKPDWSPELLLSTNYICHLSVFRKRLLDEIGGIRSGFEGSQDFDLLLRFTEKTNLIAHIPTILYHWRKIGTSAASSQLAKPLAYKAGRRALEEGLDRRGLRGRVEILSPGRYRVRCLIEGEPLVSIIVPTRNSIELLKKCIWSIEKKTAYSNYEILVVHDGSFKHEELRELQRMAAVRNVLLYQEAYSWAGMCNFAVRESRGAYLLFLNHEVSVIEPGWVEAMVAHAQRESVGVVGAKLVTSKNVIQHGGMIIGIRGLYGHAFRGLSGYSGGYFQLSDLIRNCSAVTGSCMMMRREIHDIMGCFDDKFTSTHSDIDFCLRVRQRGYRVVYTPDAVLCHDESTPQEVSSLMTDDIRMRQKWGTEMQKGDPYYNSNFSLMHEDFRLQL